MLTLMDARFAYIPEILSDNTNTSNLLWKEAEKKLLANYGIIITCFDSDPYFSRR